jgi:hypothetical protein
VLKDAIVLDYMDMESIWTIESRPTTSGNVGLKAVRYLIVVMITFCDEWEKGGGMDGSEGEDPSWSERRE